MRRKMTLCTSRFPRTVHVYVQAVTAHAAAQTTTTASDAEQKNAQALQHTEHKQRKIKTRSVYGE